MEMQTTYRSLPTTTWCQLALAHLVVYLDDGSQVCVRSSEPYRALEM